MRTPMPRTVSSGLYSTIASTSQSTAIAVPDGAVGVTLWFEDSNGDLIRGRVGFAESNTAITSLTGTDDKLGYHPAMPVYYDLNRHQRRDGSGIEWNPLYLHVGSATSSVVARGMWVF